MSDIVERLHEAKLQAITTERAVIDAADEIKRLRAETQASNAEVLRLRTLITDWANARPRLSDGSRSKTFEDACIELRKAVGR